MEKAVTTRRFNLFTGLQFSRQIFSLVEKLLKDKVFALPRSSAVKKRQIDQPFHIIIIIMIIIIIIIIIIISNYWKRMSMI